MFGGPNQNYNFGNQNMDWERGFAAQAPKFSDFGSTREDALAMVGKPQGYSVQGNLRNDLSTYMGGYQAPQWGSASGGGGGASSIGGVSAVNPQAGQANELDAFQRYEDSAYNNAMRRLEPQMATAQRDFDQEMMNRGIPVGSDAYNSARAQFDQSQAGARENAAFGAMQFGLGAQNQSFQQDHARSQLANALLQAQWQKELGLGRLGLGYAQLGEQGRQVDKGLGYDYDTFYDTLGQRAYEFDSGQDFDYWDRGNYWDFAYDRADASDYFDSWDRDYGAQQDFMDTVMNLFGQTPGSAGLNTQYNPQQPL